MSYGHIKIEPSTTGKVEVDEVYASAGCTATKALRTELLSGGEKVTFNYTGKDEEGNVCRASLAMAIPSDFVLSEFVLKGETLVVRMDGITVKHLITAAKSLKMEAIGNTKEVDGEVDRSVIEDLSMSSLGESGYASTLVLKDYDVGHLISHVATNHIDIARSNVNEVSMEPLHVTFRAEDNSSVSEFLQIGCIDSMVHVSNITQSFSSSNCASQLCYLNYGNYFSSADSKSRPRMSFGEGKADLTLDVRQGVKVMYGVPEDATVEVDPAVVTTNQTLANVTLTASGTVSLKLGTEVGSSLQFDEADFKIPDEDPFESAAMTTYVSVLVLVMAVFTSTV